MGLNPLPIEKYKAQILNLINDNDVVIISSSTGSGKTTKLPSWLFEENDRASIVVTQPRRMSTIMVANRVAEIMGVEVGKGVVGYRMAMECNTTPDTNILFLTTGTLVEILANQKTKASFSHIILDEVHGRDIYTDELLLQVKLFQLENPNWNPKIILLSATMNVRKYENYFSHCIVGSLEISKSEIIFPITTIYNNNLEEGTAFGMQIFGLKNYDPNRDDRNSNYARMPDIITQLSRLEENTAVKNGAVLIFLPGIGEIATVADTLSLYDEDNHCNWIIMELHSNMSDAEQRATSDAVLPYQRKIILSTNIAESSVTILDIVYVIDFCLTKHLKYDADTTLSSLETDLASHHQCDQRKGRTGRVAPGYCFRLVSSAFYNNVMHEESIAEMQQCGLAMTFLHLKKLDMGHPLELFKMAIDPPKLDVLESAVLHLKECGALTILMQDGSYDKLNGELTAIGQVSTSMRCDPKQARLIVYGQIFNVLNESIVMAMALSTKSLFALFCEWNNKIRGVDAFMQKVQIGRGLGSDSLANLAAFQMYLDSRKRNPKTSYTDLKAKYIKSATMRDLDFAVQRVKRKLNYYFNIWTSDVLHLDIDVIAMSPKLVLQFQLLLCAASYPQIFFRPTSPNQNAYINCVNVELGPFNPTTSFLLEPEFHYNKPPTENQIAEVKSQLAEFPFASNAPTVTWMRSALVVEYHPDKNDPSKWVRQCAMDVFTGLKWKNLNQSLFWTIPEADRKYYGGKSRIKLMGPRSPIAINFKCYFPSIIPRIIIDRNSVNNSTLDDCYPNAAGYVISSLQMTQKKRIEKGESFISIIAKESTLMLPIPGIFSMMHLIFSPQFQLHSARNNQGFIGGLAGLGAMTGTTTGIFPNHDAKINFDVMISPQEIQQINAIRQRLNHQLKLDKFILCDAMSRTARKRLVEDILGLLHVKRPILTSSPLQKQSWTINGPQPFQKSKVYETFIPHKI